MSQSFSVGDYIVDLSTKELGKGSFGIVFEGYSPSGEKAAIKAIEYEKRSDFEKSYIVRVLLSVSNFVLATRNRYNEEA